MRHGMQIGAVSDRTGLSVDAIRFYEKQRLITRPLRTEGGFRLYNREDVERIAFIRRVQRLGFSLSEIRELMVIQDHGEACSHVRDLLQSKVATVRQKIRELRALEKQLAQGLAKCEDNLEGDCRRNSCPVLESL